MNLFVNNLLNTGHEVIIKTMFSPKKLEETLANNDGLATNIADALRGIYDKVCSYYYFNPLITSGKFKWVWKAIIMKFIKN